jgi:hypothetical protein
VILPVVFPLLNADKTVDKPHYCHIENETLSKRFFQIAFDWK